MWLLKKPQELRAEALPLLPISIHSSREPKCLIWHRCYLTCRASPGSKPPCLTLGMLLVCTCCRLKHTPITPFSGIDLTDVQLMQGQQDGAVSPQAHGAHPHTVLILVVSELFCHELFCASVLSSTAVLSRDSWDQRQSCSLHPAVAEAPIWCLCFGLKSG